MQPQSLVRPVMHMNRRGALAARLFEQSHNLVDKAGAGLEEVFNAGHKEEAEVREMRNFRCRFNLPRWIAKIDKALSPSRPVLHTNEPLLLVN